MTRRRFSPLRAFTPDLTLAACAVAPCAAAPAELTVPMALVDDSGLARPIGRVTVTESAFGLVFTPFLEGLAPGLHGFHVRENASCEPGEQNGRKVPFLAAGGHYDPTGTKRHGAPWGDGHLGDLPPLYADIAGRAGAGATAEDGRPAPPFADGPLRRRQPCRPSDAPGWWRGTHCLRRGPLALIH